MTKPRKANKERDKTITQIINEFNKLVPKGYKSKHDRVGSAKTGNWAKGLGSNMQITSINQRLFRKTNFKIFCDSNTETNHPRRLETLIGELRRKEKKAC